MPKKEEGNNTHTHTILLFPFGQKGKKDTHTHTHTLQMGDIGDFGHYFLATHLFQLPCFFSFFWVDFFPSAACDDMIIIWGHRWRSWAFTFPFLYLFSSLALRSYTRSCTSMKAFSMSTSFFIDGTFILYLRIPYLESYIQCI